MFSGIVKGTGQLLQLSDTGGDRHVVIGFAGVAMKPPEVGASIAVNGVCVTATASGAERFEADLSGETLAVTTLAALQPGARVNLEPALRLGDRVDGHLVSGHVDGVARVVDIRPSARSLKLTVELPPGLACYVVRKGSIALDGVSLTVNAVDGAELEVNVVPHTREATIIADYRPGSAINVEVDMLARYVERMLSSAEDAAQRPPSED